MTLEPCWHSLWINTKAKKIYLLNPDVPTDYNRFWTQIA